MEFGHRFCCLLWIIMLECILGQTRDPFRDCPKKPELIGHRRCLKACSRESDCRGRRRTCLCDDVCGTSCVNPNLKCQPLEDIDNGRVQIFPYSKFNAVANYSCVPGFMLEGHRTRICVGDGSWTGKKPTCVFSSWACRSPPHVENALFDRKTGPYPVGTVVQYYCRRGYYRDGLFTATCGEGSWNGPRMSCIPKSCGHPGDVPNGIRHGDLFFYPHRVDYRCQPGYRLIGHSFRICKDDGSWSSDLPFCTPIQCRPLYKPQNGKVLGHSIAFGSTLMFECNPGFRIIGTNKRTCQANGTWTGEPVVCQLIDCGLPEFHNGVIEGDSTSLAAEIVFRCHPGTTFEGTSTMAKCLETGQWSDQPPKCWRKCMAPTINDGVVVRRNQNAEHKMELDYTCDDGFEKQKGERSICYNGTWRPPPRCLPAPCRDRPPIIRNGEYRYVGTNHLDKVKYECKIGYSLMNDPKLECRHGKWRGLTPWCKPLYCEHPGKVRHGEMLLVGVKGKYTYHEHVPNIGQGQQIEFHCDRNYKLVGSERSTCMNGHWNPRPRPKKKCVKGTHVNLPFRFRLVRRKRQ